LISLSKYSIMKQARGEGNKAPNSNAGH